MIGLVLKEDVAPVGSPVVLNVIAFENPPLAGAMLIVKVAVPPREPVATVGEAEIAKS